MSGWEADAHLLNTSRWSNRLDEAAIIARSVEPGTGQSERGSRRSLMADEKCSASKFADAADMSKTTVLRVLRTWDRMADDGHVPPRAALSPGVPVALDGVDVDLFKKHYRDDAPQTVGEGLVDVHAALLDEDLDRDALAAITISMDTYGQLYPVTVWRNHIVDGYLRLVAALDIAEHSKPVDLYARQMPDHATERQALTWARATRIHRRYSPEDYQRHVLDPLAVLIVGRERGLDLGDGLRSYRLLTECRRREPSTARIDGYLAALGGEQSCLTLPRVTDWEQFLITLPDLGETDG